MALFSDLYNVGVPTTSADLAIRVSDETGTGNLVFNDSPVFTGTPLTTYPNSSEQISNKQYVDDTSSLISAKKFGVVGDGITSDSPSISNWLAFCNDHGLIGYLPAGDYLISSTVTITIKGKLEVIADPEAKLILSNGSVITFDAQQVFSGENTSLLSLDQTDLELSPTITGSDISISDYVAISTKPTVSDEIRLPHTVRPYVKNVKGSVATIDESTNTITLSEPPEVFSFDSLEADVKICKRASLVWSGGKVVVPAGEILVGSRFQLASLSGSRIQNMVFIDESLRQESGPDLLYLNGCIDTDISHIYQEGLRYGVAVNACRNTYIRDIVSIKSRHPVDASTWSNHTYVRDFKFFETQGGVSTHASFNNWFENGVDEIQSIGGPNLRSIGGGIRNVRISHILDVWGGTPGMRPGYQYLYDMYDVFFEKVYAPNLTLSVDNVRNVFIKNCELKSLDISGGSPANVGLINYEKNRILSPLLNRIRGAIPVNNPNSTLDFENTSGSIYELRPALNFCQRDNVKLKSSGLIFPRQSSISSTDNFTLRIYTNPGDMYYAGGYIILTVHMLLWPYRLCSQRKLVFSFFTGVTSGASLVSSEDLTPYSSSSLDLTVSNVVPNFASQTSAWREYYFQFNSSFSSSVSPFSLNCYYDLEVIDA
jgi:hypothetical protein